MLTQLIMRYAALSSVNKKFGSFSLTSQGEGDPYRHIRKLPPTTLGATAGRE